MPSEDTLKDFRDALGQIASGAHFTSKQLSYFASVVLDQHPCEHPSSHFDRSLCVCGSMHDYCDHCGMAMDCELDHA